MAFWNAGSELRMFQSQVPTYRLPQGTSNRPYRMAVDGGLGRVKHIKLLAQCGAPSKCSVWHCSQGRVCLCKSRLWW